MKNKFNIYKCEKCGAMIEVLEECACNDCGIKCCSENMKKLVANTVDASIEKHVPVYDHVEDEIVVRVGETKHPMTKEHYIKWIALVSQNRVTKVELYPEQDIEVRFKYESGSTIYAYCNQHGLWSAEVN